MNTSKPLLGRPIIFGEVLFDRFPDGTEVLGGAPFNVAWHLQGFGCSPLLISRAGDDPEGQRIRAAMQSWGLDTTGLQLDAKHPTGLVEISMAGTQHTFDILPNRAYDHVDAELGHEAIRGADLALAYHGTLIMRTPEVSQVLDRLLATARVPVFVDVNLREPWWREGDLPPVLERARWVKVNDEELFIIASRTGLGSDDLEETARGLRQKFALELLIVTLGARGAVAFDSSHDSIRVEPKRDIEIVDTVGAGDAFSSVVLLGLLKGWPAPIMLRRAQAFASRVCAQRGATREDPQVYETVRA